MTQIIKIAGWPGETRGHVVFVHGLGGHAYDTWSYRNDPAKFWPLWLARDIEGLSAWTLGYAAPPTNWLGNAMPLQDRAVEVLERLLGTPELEHGPVVFICHSLGGLVVKQLLREANDQKKRRPDVGILLDRVKGVVFIATPHTGSTHANLLDRLRLIAWPSSATRDLVKNDPNLRNLNVWYRNWSTSISHLIFYETVCTAAGNIVDPGSADAGLPGIVPIPIDADHIDICKPADERDLMYTRTRDFLVNDIIPESEGDKHGASLDTLVLPLVSTARPRIWGPVAVRLVIVVFVGFIFIRGMQAAFWTPDPLETATVQQIEQALGNKYPDLTPEQIVRIIRSLREARGDPSFEQAVEQAKNGNIRVAIGIWQQIYEDREKQQKQARKEQAEAARNLAAIAIVENAAAGLLGYRTATELDPQNMEGWFALVDAALSAGTLEEAKSAARQYISLAEMADDEPAKGLGYLVLGDILTREDDVSAAHEAFRQAYATARRLADADPTNDARQHALGRCYIYIGNLLLREKKTAEARKSFEDARDILRPLTEADPANAGFQRTLAGGYEALGKTLVIEGNMFAAREAYKESFAIAKRLADGERTDAKRQRDLAAAYANLGDVEDDLPEARNAYEKARDTLKRLADADPTNSEKQSELALIYGKLGAVLQAEGRLSDARESFEGSIDILKPLTIADSGNIERAFRLVMSYLSLSDVLLAMENVPDARSALEGANDIFKLIAEVDPANVERHSDLAGSFSKLGDLLVTEGNLSAARKAYEDARDIFIGVAGADSTNAQRQRQLAGIYMKLGHVLLYERKLFAAQNAFDNARDILKPLVDADSIDADFRFGLAVNYQSLGLLLVDEDDRPAAREAYKESFAIAKRMADDNPTNAEFQHGLALSYANLADIHQLSGDSENALSAIRHGEFIMHRLTELQPDNAQWQQDHAWFSEQLVKLEN